MQVAEIDQASGLVLSATPLPTRRPSAATPTEPTTTTTTSTTTTTTMSTTDGIIVTKHEFPADTGLTENDVEFLDEISHNCPPTAMRGLFWNWTEVGSEAIQPCPPGATGFARWRCGTDGRWAGDTPNLGECQSSWLNRLETALLSGRAVVSSVADELAVMTESKSL